MNEILSQIFLGGGLRRRLEAAKQPTPPRKSGPVVTDAKLTWTRWDGGACIQGCPSQIGGTLKIPDTIDGLPVTRIGEAAFFARDDLTGLLLPDPLTHIDRWAFRQCDSLGSVQFPDGLGHIGCGAFSGCSQLREITLRSGLLELDRDAFRGCANLEQAIFPDSELYPARDGTVGLYPSYFDAFGSCPHLVIYAPADSFAQHYAQEYEYRFLPLNDMTAPAPRRWTARLWAFPGGSVDLSADGGDCFVEWSVIEKPARFESGEIPVPGLPGMSLPQLRDALSRILPPAVLHEMDVPSETELSRIEALNTLLASTRAAQKSR